MTRTVLQRRLGLATCAAAGLLVAACHRDKPEDHMARGKALAAKQSHAAAVIEFKNVLQADPNSGEARFLLGRELLLQGDPKSAEIELEKAFDAKYDPEQVVPLLVKAEVLAGQPEKVSKQIGRADLKTPEANAALQTMLGNSLLAEGHKEEALAAFAAAEKLVPDFPDAKLAQARIRATGGDLAGAEKDVDALLANNPKMVDALVLKGDLDRAHAATTPAIESYQAAIKEDPRNFAARINLAGALIANHQLDLAQEQVDALKKQSPRHPGVAYMDALIAFNRKDYPRANDAITLSLASAPKSGLAQLLAGAISTAMNQPAQAETHLAEAVRLNPNGLYARKLLTSVYLKQRQPQKADEVLAPALAAAPNDGTLVSLAGEVALMKGDFNGAAKYFDKAAKINPADANIRTQGAAVDFARGDDASGFAELEAASKASVDNPRADIALVLARLQRKQFDQALAAWKTLEKRQPNNPQTYNLLAAIDVGRGDVPAARKALDRAVEISPTYFPAVANLAAFDERNHDVDGARQRYKTLLAKDPGNLGALLSLAQLESSHGAGPDVVLPLLKEARRTNENSEQPVLALAAYYASRNDPKQALTVLQDGLAQSPNSPTYLNMSAQLLMQTGSNDQAIVAYRKLVNLDPDSLDRQMRLGEAELAANQPDAAVQTFRNALKKQPTAYQAQSVAIGSLLRANKIDEASRLLANIREQSPKSPVLPELEADIKLTAKQYADATAIFRKALAQHPTPNLVIKTYSSIYLGGDPKEANAFIADWVKSHPKDLTVRLFDADLALRAKDYPRATQNYRAVLEAQPNDVGVLNNLAWALWQQHDPQALSYAQKANAIAPDSPQVGDTLGWMLVEQGQTKRGLELLQKASAAAPAQREIALHLAKAQLKDGNKDAARSTLQALVKAAPDSVEGKESKDLMATL